MRLTTIKVELYEGGRGGFMFFIQPQLCLVYKIGAQWVFEWLDGYSANSIVGQGILCCITFSNSIITNVLTSLLQHLVDISNFLWYYSTSNRNMFRIWSRPPVSTTTSLVPVSFLTGLASAPLALCPVQVVSTQQAVIFCRQVKASHDPVQNPKLQWFPSYSE